jgi:transposase
MPDSIAWSPIPPARHLNSLFCWSRARRKLYNVFVTTKSPIAEEAVKRIAEIYAIESGVRGDPAEERQRVRDQKSRPLVEAMHGWLTEQLGRIQGASTLAKAICYALNHWNGCQRKVEMSPGLPK